MAGLSLEDGMGGSTGQVARRTTEEEDMAYFEKRYQARVRLLFEYMQVSSVIYNVKESYQGANFWTTG